jgi:hypothetical protein
MEELKSRKEDNSSVLVVLNPWKNSKCLTMHRSIINITIGTRFTLVSIKAKRNE